MKPNYVTIINICGYVKIIQLTEEELRESEQYEDFEEFLFTLEDKYDFTVNHSVWCTTEELNVSCYKDGKEVEHAKLV